MQKDAAGLTRVDVAALSLPQGYDGTWDWNGGDSVPSGGGLDVIPLPGGDIDDSYDPVAQSVVNAHGASAQIIRKCSSASRVELGMAAGA